MNITVQYARTYRFWSHFLFLFLSQSRAEQFPRSVNKPLQRAEFFASKSSTTLLKISLTISTRLLQAVPFESFYSYPLCTKPWDEIIRIMPKGATCTAHWEDSEGLVHIDMLPTMWSVQSTMKPNGNTNTVLRLGIESFSAMLTAKQLGGVTPEVNLRNLSLHADEKACKSGIYPDPETQGRRHQKSKTGASVAP